VLVRQRRFRSVAHGRWTEIADRVFVGRYRFYDQDIGAVLTDDERGVAQAGGELDPI
jgi:hypothetical protein